MMSDRGNFSCLQFPKEWGQPRFNFGDRVLNGKRPVIVMGVSYVHPNSVDGRDSDKVGWWFWVADLQHHWHGCEFGECWGIHEEDLQPSSNVIQAPSSSVGRVSQPQQSCNTSATHLQPLHSLV